MKLQSNHGSHLMPERISHLRRDENGVHVPFFVAWQRDGQPAQPGGEGATPNFKMIDLAKRDRCIEDRRCWICSVKLGRLFAFLGGPQMGINGISLHGPMHTDCARYVATQFVSLLFGSPSGKVRLGEQMLRSEVEVFLLWHCREFSILEAGHTRRLFQLTQPHMVEWFCDGRAATRSEVEAAIESALPTLRQIAIRAKAEDKMQTALTSFVSRYLPVK